MMAKILPRDVTATAIFVDNAALHLHAFAQALVRPDLRDEIPRLKSTAVNAARLARDSLGVLLENLGEPLRTTSKAAKRKRTHRG